MTISTEDKLSGYKMAFPDFMRGRRHATSLKVRGQYFLHTIYAAIAPVRSHNTDAPPPHCDQRIFRPTGEFYARHLQSVSAPYRTRCKSRSAVQPTLPTHPASGWLAVFKLNRKRNVFADYHLEPNSKYK